MPDHYVDEAWIYRTEEMLKDPRVERDALGRVISIPRRPLHEHTLWLDPGNHSHTSPSRFLALANTHSHGVRYDDLRMPMHSYHYDPPVIPSPHEHKFDPTMLYRKAKIEYDDVVDITLDTLDVRSWLKSEMQRQLDDHITKEFNKTVLYGDGYPLPNNKENNMSERSLRTPESPIESKDLAVAVRALGYNAMDELFDAVALVQGLEANQRLLQTHQLKAQDVGNHVQIIDGVGGVLSDIIPQGEFDRNSGPVVKAVLDGKMVDIPKRELVVLTALSSPVSG